MDQKVWIYGDTIWGSSAQYKLHAYFVNFLWQMKDDGISHLHFNLFEDRYILKSKHI